MCVRLRHIVSFLITLYQSSVKRMRTASDLYPLLVALKEMHRELQVLRREIGGTVTHTSHNIRSGPVGTEAMT